MHWLRATDISIKIQFMPIITNSCTSAFSPAAFNFQTRCPNSGQTGVNLQRGWKRAEGSGSTEEVREDLPGVRPWLERTRWGKSAPPGGQVPGMYLVASGPPFPFSKPSTARHPSTYLISYNTHNLLGSSSWCYYPHLTDWATEAGISNLPKGTQWVSVRTGTHTGSCLGDQEA